jgi:hypothetical protein
MVVGVGFCKIKVDSNFLLVLNIKCTKFHQDRSKTVDLHTKYTNNSFSFIYVYRFSFIFWTRRVENFTLLKMTFHPSVKKFQISLV